MPKPIKGRINVSKILKEHLFRGTTGKFLNVVIWPNKDGADKYGNTHSIKQEISREARDKGAKEPFIGDLKFPDDEQTPPPRQQQRPARQTPPPDDLDF